MTPAVAHAIASALGHEGRTSIVTEPVGGGDSHPAHVLLLGTDRVFVKHNVAKYSDAFLTEADALASIAGTATVRVPHVLGSGVADATAWLALEWLDLRALSTGSATRLGEQLAALHRTSAPEHGWPTDNWIGGAVQHNARLGHWPTFWRRQRIDPQLERLAARDRALLRHVETAVDAGLADLAAHAPVPALLHGDLWAGNAAADAADGAPVIFDPASYFGDRETDIAMTRLFGGFPPAFYRAYEHCWPLPDGSRQRTALYNLYHALNHVNLFGAGYTALVQRHVDMLRELAGR